MKWYKECYFNSKEWLLTNFEKINISNNELVVLLLIIYANENNISIDNNFFQTKMRLESKDIDSIIASLVSKHFLSIIATSKSVEFNIDGIFEYDPKDSEINENKDIYELLTEIFNRPLSQVELQKSSDLIEKFGVDKFDHALRIAEANEKINIRYIEAILNNEENK